METFNFPGHKVRHTYPEGDQIKFGGGYTFAAAPVTPEQRTFILKFPVLTWFFNGAGVADATISPQENMYALMLFYEEHRLHKRFIYPHPLLGNLTVRFAKPLEIPEGITGGNGTTEEFELQFIEQP
jgi:hypothetical protein